MGSLAIVEIRDRSRAENVVAPDYLQTPEAAPSLDQIRRMIETQFEHERLPACNSSDIISSM